MRAVKQRICDRRVLKLICALANAYPHRLDRAWRHGEN
jgi:hypothetical protein